MEGFGGAGTFLFRTIDDCDQIAGYAKDCKRDLLITVKTHDEVLLHMGRFMQYYREYGKYLERTYHFVERVGMDNLRKILIEDSLGIAARLDADIRKAVDAYVNPCKEAELPAHPRQFSAPDLAHALATAENNG